MINYRDLNAKTFIIHAISFNKFASINPKNETLFSVKGLC